MFVCHLVFGLSFRLSRSNTPYDCCGGGVGLANPPVRRLPPVSFLSPLSPPLTRYVSMRNKPLGMQDARAKGGFGEKKTSVDIFDEVDEFDETAADGGGVALQPQYLLPHSPLLPQSSAPESWLSSHRNNPGQHVGNCPLVASHRVCGSLGSSVLFIHLISTV